MSSPKLTSDKQHAWVTLIYVLLLISLVAIFIASLKDAVESAKKVKQEKKYRQSCQEVSIEDVLSDENYMKGKLLTFSGKLTGNAEDDSLFCLCLGGEPEQYVYFENHTNRTLSIETDIEKEITIWGASKGLYPPIDVEEKSDDADIEEDIQYLLIDAQSMTIAKPQTSK